MPRHLPHLPKRPSIDLETFVAEKRERLAHVKTMSRRDARAEAIRVQHERRRISESHLTGEEKRAARKALGEIENAINVIRSKGNR